MGLVLLDQRHLQKERLKIRIGGDDLDVGYLLPQAPRLEGVDVFLEIGADAAAQVDGLAYVEDPAFLVLMQVDARPTGQICQDFLDVFWRFETHEPIIAPVSER